MAKKKPTTISIKKDRPQKNTHRVPCEECKKLGGVLHYKLDPRNWSVIRKLLCRPCAVKDGWIKLTFDRVMQSSGL